MKNAAKIALDSLVFISPKKVHMIAVLGEWKQLEEPVLSSTLTCEECGGSKHYTPMIDPAIDDRCIWICANPICLTCKLENLPRAMVIPPTPKRTQPWGLWCELNDIGNIHVDVKFEKIQQSQGKIDFLKKFGTKPQGIALMQGASGLGKTYASLGVCELFTRHSNSCIFITQKAMAQRWLESFRSERIDAFIPSLSKVNLLVIDDFGTSEIPPGFMSFFMDLINSRMQWTDRGTMISTNLSNDKFAEYCGEALADRFNTGQKLVFTGKSRRKPNIL